MKVVLTQPNYAWFNKRSFGFPPYTLALLNACLGGRATLFDPNFNNMTRAEVFAYFEELKPDVVGVSSVSTEYINANRLMNKIIKEASPHSTVIQGGIIPTVLSEMEDLNADYWMGGECEYRLPQFLDGGGESPRKFIRDLDAIPFPDYGNLDLLYYGNRVQKYAQSLVAHHFPYAVTLTSRGCPYRCIFCAASFVSGKKIRYRSADNVLAEVDMLYSKGIKEIIFLDDHFLGNRQRAIEIMEGLNKYNLAWKCANLTIFSLDEEILRLMKDSGCYQLTLSIESGNQHILDKIIKKPVKLDLIPDLLERTRNFGFEVIANFVIGFPGETWEQIRDTTRLAGSIDVDLVNFHIATPLPRTELMEICLRNGLIKGNNIGYTKGAISTVAFTPRELEILRAFEWDRINFSTPERKEAVARIQGISLSELERWRVNTRRRCGVNVV